MMSKKKDKLKICMLLTDVFDPKFPARPAITEIYGKFLPNSGHEITWIIPYRDKIQDLKVSDEISKNVTIKFIYWPISLNLLSKFFNLILIYFRKYKLLDNLLKEENYDIIQVRNDVFDALISIYLRKKFNIPVVFQYTFPKEAYKYSDSKIYLKIFGKVQEIVLNFVLNKSDFILPISKWMMEELVEKGFPKKKMIPLPMGVNLDSFKEKKGIEIRKKYSLENCNLLLYSGRLDKKRGLEVLINAFRYVNQINSDVKLILVGEGNHKEELKSLSESMELQDKIIFTGQVSYSEIPNYIAASDICISSIRPYPIYKISSPTKLFEYMAMIKPTIANKGIYEQDYVLKDSKCGLLVDFDSSSFFNAIIFLLNDPEKSEEMGKNGREWVEKNRSYELMAIDMKNLYYKLLDKFD